MYGDTPYCNVFVDNVTGLLRSYWCKTRDQNATLEQMKQLQACSNIAREKSGKSDENPGKFFTDDEWLVIQRLADEVGEAEREVKDTETSALPIDAGVVRVVQAELKTRGALLTLLPPEWKTRETGMVCRFHGMGQL
eukprot:g22060.t1